MFDRASPHSESNTIIQIFRGHHTLTLKLVVFTLGSFYPSYLNQLITNTHSKWKQFGVDFDIRRAPIQLREQRETIVARLIKHHFSLTDCIILSNYQALSPAEHSGGLRGGEGVRPAAGGRPPRQQGVRHRSAAK